MMRETYELHSRWLSRADVLGLKPGRRRTLACLQYLRGAATMANILGQHPLEYELDRYADRVSLNGHRAFEREGSRETGE